MRRSLDWILLLVVIGVGGYLAYTHPGQVKYLKRAVISKVAPCASPLTYSIVGIDPRFGVATTTVIADLKEAEGIWEKPSTKDLFQYVPEGGEVSVYLVYDERQAATDKLSTLGYKIDENKANYESLRAEYDALAARIKRAQTSYQTQLAAYQRDLKAYNAEVQHWNEVGGAPRSEFARLNAEKVALQSRASSINEAQDRINSDIDTLNALATALNQLIVHLNLEVDQYNQTGAAAGEFEEGLYELQGGVQTITIYEFSNHNQLIRVLAHEMGHALGLEHVEDDAAIMYKINRGKERRILLN
jgi:hypothetical protein